MKKLTKGFTMLEVVIALTLILLISGSAFIAMGSSRSTSMDAVARGTVETVVTAQLTRAGLGGAFTTDKAELPGITDEISLTSGNSTYPTIASVDVQSGAVGIAVMSASGTCIMAHISSPADGMLVSYPVSSSPACTGGTAISAA